MKTTNSRVLKYKKFKYETILIINKIKYPYGMGIDTHT